MSDHAHESHDEHHEHHDYSYMKVYWILLVLFIVVMGPEVAVFFTYVAMEQVLVLSTAFGIALVKAYYVVAYFMHLKFGKDHQLYAIDDTRIHVPVLLCGRT